jgi:hypothetical protein
MDSNRFDNFMVLLGVCLSLFGLFGLPLLQESLTKDPQTMKIFIK